MSRMLKKDEQGFTLVELLVVIIIIGILAAIAIPVFLNQKKRAAEGVLKADIRKVAMTVEEWSYEHSSWDELRAVTLDNNVVHFSGAGVYNSPAAPPSPQWNSHAELKNIWVSDKVDMTVTIRSAPSGTWTAAHGFGDFCLSARHLNSNYAYPGGNAGRYDEMLYYDVMFGGLATMEQLVAAKQAGQPISCTGWTNGYMTAHGIT